MNYEIISVREETHDTRTYFLKPLEEGFSYQAGQFITFFFHINGRSIRRSYSLSTCPGVDPWPGVTVKRIPNGEISRFIHTYWKAGDMVNGLAPTGRFSLEEGNQDTPVFFLAAGSGISPVLGLLKEALYNHSVPVHLFYSSKTPKNTIFYKELKDLEQSFPGRFFPLFFFSSAKHLAEARLSKVTLERLVNERLQDRQNDARFFLCGPYDYMQMARIVLVTMGFSRDNIRQEIFEIMAPPAKYLTLPYTEPKNVHLKLGNKEYVITVPYNKTVLDVALEEGIPAPYNCRAGRCSACMGKCLQGKVKMHYNEVLTEKDEQKGFVLTCMAHPLSDDVEIQY